ncbi:uncharacterized protein LOC143215940 [Lasioglossum baleicum]|uniref:uncharacterized protein LOC143215940 n=1 Tax=Lasioglossum baleicum TaxID=434251 RepID=UPI003FCCF4AA
MNRALRSPRTPEKRNFSPPAGVRCGPLNFIVWRFRAQLSPVYNSRAFMARSVTFRTIRDKKLGYKSTAGSPRCRFLHGAMRRVTFWVSVAAVLAVFCLSIEDTQARPAADPRHLIYIITHRHRKRHGDIIIIHRHRKKPRTHIIYLAP